MAKVCILGGGSWGIGLSVVLHKNGHEVTVWSAVPAEIQMLQEKHEHKMLPGVKLSEDMIFTTDDKSAIEGKDLLVMAVASSYTRSTAHRISPLVAKGQRIVSVSKGIEEHTLMTQAQIIEDEIPQAQVAVLSGPTHAEEVSRGIPTTIVAGSKSKSCAEYVQNLFMNEVFRVYTSPDVLGIELGGALKNVVALAAGIADGL
ncbi:MAG: 2-dehydropantoate 2-reductase N-terminal domain-containing protein, partial [Lachnospiraceae bacterium]|nr:2-dehydropantoate 2-reductase N-terminal domain-containing protein [Lachnospiraceae bacterium]